MTEKYVAKNKKKTTTTPTKKVSKARCFCILLLYTIKVAKSRKPHAQHRVVILNACTSFSRLHGAYMRVYLYKGRYIVSILFECNAALNIGTTNVTIAAMLSNHIC